jgi:membrane-bound serine protease (ClpP class)
MMLFDRTEPFYRLSLALIIPATLVTAAFFVFIAGAGLRAQVLPVKLGKESMIGKTVSAVTPVDAQTGKVLFEGEYWNATSAVRIEAGRLAEIVEIAGLTLQVKPKNP